jgi:hypothetical protein
MPTYLKPKLKKEEVIVVDRRKILNLQMIEENLDLINGNLKESLMLKIKPRRY